MQRASTLDTSSPDPIKRLRHNVEAYWDSGLGFKDVKENTINMTTGSPGFGPPEFLLGTLALFISNIGDDSRVYKDAFMHKEGMAQCVSDYMSAKGMIAKDRVLKPENIVFANGVTQLASAGMKSLVKPEDYMVFPVPTYGFFPRHPAVNADHFRSIALSAGNNYHLTPDALEKTLDNIVNEAEPDSKIWLFFINPHNPSGAVHDQQEIDALAKVLLQPRFRNVNIISDMVYAGSERRKRSGSFAAIPELADRTLVFHGLSKAYGAASLRTGVAVGPEEMVRGLAQHIQQENGFTSVIAQWALMSIYMASVKDTSDPERAAIASYSEELEAYQFMARHKYAHRQAILTDLINGDNPEHLKHDGKDGSFLFNEGVSGDQLPELQKLIKKHGREYEKIYQYAAEHHGLPGMRVCHKPESGFFQLVDVSGLIGKYYGEKKIENSMDVGIILNHHGVAVIPGDLFLHPENEHAIRLSYSISADKLVQGIGRMQEAISLLKDHPSKLPEQYRREVGQGR